MAISIVLLITCTVCVNLMYRTTNELISIASSAAQTLPNDMEATAQQLQEFEKLWQRTEPKWQFIAIHSDLENVSQTLLEAQDALITGDADTAKHACDLLPKMLESIIRKELPTLGNIF